MNTRQERITAVQKQRAAVTDQINQLNANLEDAAIAGDAARVREAQADIAARQAIIARIDKAISDLQAGKSAEDIKAELATLDAAVATIAKKSAELDAHMEKNVAPALAEFIVALEQGHTIAQERADAGYEILRRLPDRESRTYQGITGRLALMDTSFAAAIEDELLKAGVFSKLAPAHWIKLQRHDMPGIAQVIAYGSQRLASQVARAAEIAKQGVGK